LGIGIDGAAGAGVSADGVAGALGPAVPEGAGGLLVAGAASCFSHPITPSATTRTHDQRQSIFRMKSPSFRKNKNEHY
jgi:hypothetical protein